MGQIPAGHQEYTIIGNYNFHSSDVTHYSQVSHSIPVSKWYVILSKGFFFKLTTFFCWVTIQDHCVTSTFDAFCKVEYTSYGYLIRNLDFWPHISLFENYWCLSILIHHLLLNFVEILLFFFTFQTLSFDTWANCVVYKAWTESALKAGPAQGCIVKRVLRGALW